MATNNDWNNQILAGNSKITLNTATTGVDISSDANAAAVNVGSGAAAKTVIVGSNTAGSTLALRSPSGTPTTVSNGLTISAADLAVSAGNITLPNTTSSTAGTLLINAVRFVHQYGATTNTFVGSGAGNYTMTSQGLTTGIGQGCLAALAAADGNGGDNTAVGALCLGKLTTSGLNCALGINAGRDMLTGTANTTMGYNSLLRVTSGNYNCCFGGNAGNAYTTSDSDNIVIGYNVPGTAGQSNQLVIGNATGTGDGNLNSAVICGINAKSTGGSSSVVLISTNTLGTTSSGTVTLNTTTNQIDISADASATIVNLGTGGAAKTVTIGSTNTTSSLALKYGTNNFSMASATGAVMNATSAGYLTYPLQCAFLVYLGSTVANATGNGANFTLGTTTALTKVFDQNTNITTGGTFTAPVTGRYQLNVQSQLTNCTVASAHSINITTSNRTYTYVLNRAASNANFYALSGVLADFDAADTSTFVITGTGEAGNTDGVGGSATLVTYISGYLAC